MSDRSQNPTAAARERQKVGMLVPPPLLLIAIGALSIAAQLMVFGSFNISTSGVALGVLVILASALIEISCWRSFKAADTPFRPVSPATAIVNSGLYRVSRNPMYVGMAGLLAGVGIMLGSYVFIAAVVIFIVIVHFGVVMSEERYLEALHGEAYRRYKQSVRRWL